MEVQMAKNGQEQTTDIIPDIVETQDIKNLIYVVRGKQVMLDSDLAMLYQVGTKVFNQAVSRNIERFPENFRFQLTKEEFVTLIGILEKSDLMKSSYNKRGRKKQQR